MAITVTNDFTDIDQFDTSNDQSADGSGYGTIGTNSQIYVETTASNVFQCKSSGLGAMGHYNSASNIDFSTKPQFFGWFLNLDYPNTEANNGLRLRLANEDFSTTTNYIEFTIGGNDTLRTKVDGFTAVTCDTTRYRNYQTGTAPGLGSVDAVGLSSDITSTPSGQNTAFIDYFYHGSKYTISGTGGDSAGIESYDKTNGRGVFKNIGGIYYLLCGYDFGDTATGSSDFSDSGEVWNFEDQYAVGNTLYTLTFVANGTGTNTVDFGTGTGSGDTETGSGGNIIIAKRQPFLIVATNSNITTSFYGCSFLNAGQQWGTIQLENTNVKAVSCLFDSCGPVTIKNSAEVKQTTIATTAALGSRSAVEMDAGSLIGSTVSGAKRGVHFKGTSTRTVKNNSLANNTTAYYFDTAPQTVTVDNDSFSGNTYDIENGGTIGTADSYAESNVDDYVNVNGAIDGVAQSFSGDGKLLVGCAFYLRTFKTSTGEATGNMTAKLYAHTGTYGTSSTPTGSALATSDTIAVITFMQSYNLIEFNFPTPYLMASGTNYCIAIEYTTGTTNAGIHVGTDASTPGHGGNSSTWNGTSWTAVSTEDVAFYVYSMGANAVTADSYADTNQNAATALDGDPTAVGQSITGNGGVLTNVRWYLQGVGGSRTGSMVCKLYAHSGTFGTSSVPTGAALATSDEVAASSVDTSYERVQFQFTDEYTLVNATKYVVVLEYTGTATDYINVGTDTTTPGHGGNFSTYTDPTWTAVSGTDACFYVSTGGLLKINATNGANPGSYVNSTEPPGATKITNTVNVTLTVKDGSGAAVQDAQCAVYKTSDNTQIMNEDSNASGIATEGYNYGQDSPADTPIYWRVRKSSDTSPVSTKYKSQSGTGTITSSGFSVTVTLVEDPNA